MYKLSIQDMGSLQQEILIVLDHLAVVLVAALLGLAGS